ncbi:MAG TPA: metallophosphoesterase [Vicinamibacterales bacterium]|nr:metallophosphoesterase [Vicinamibacterales bacterium]
MSPPPNRRLATHRLVPLLLLTMFVWHAAAQQVVLPATPDSVKFAVIGDNGNGDRPEYEIATLMAQAHERFPFDRVIMLGDNIYGGQSASDMVKKFSQPYKVLLDEGVKFYASLGNHDDPGHVRYPPWNMNGERYYTYTVKNVRFFALDSNKVDQKELAWLEDALKAAQEDWKICYFHHPLYSDGGTHGSSVDVRVLFEPLFVKYGVNVVFSGHDHIYERLTPQKGIYYFVEGASGELRKGDTRPSAMTAKAFDEDRSFMLVEIGGHTLFFQTTSRAGVVVDSGTIERQGRR